MLAACTEENAAGRAFKDAAERMAVARAFLGDVRGQTGVKARTSGLLYKVERRGRADMAPPGLSSSILIHYRAKLTDGNVIDSSYERNAPAWFDMDSLLAGLREGAGLMQPGDAFIFYVPPQLAYGARGKPPLIPSNAVLIYEVELIDIRPAGSA